MEAGPPGGPAWPATARVEFEWLDGRTWLVQRWTIDWPVAPDGIAIVGAGDEPGAFRQHYFDSRGVHRVYEMTLEGGTWTLERDAPDPFPQRFTATFEDSGAAISGRWEKREGSEDWAVDFDVTYRREG